MIIKKFQGKTEREAVEAAKKELGENVVIMNAKEVKQKGLLSFLKAPLMEVTVALEEESERTPAVFPPQKETSAPIVPDSIWEKEEKDMTDRLAALAAAVMLAVTLAACGAADDKANGTAPDTTPNGSITTQPDTNGTDTGSAKDDLNGGRTESGRADEDGQMDGTAETRRYDRALAASLSQLILNRIGE